MSDDFFSNVPFIGPDNGQGESVDSFARAIAVRFGSADLLTARLLPGEISNNQSHTRSQQQPDLHPVQSPLPLPPPTFSSFSLPPKRAQQSAPSTALTATTVSPGEAFTFTPVQPSGLAPYLADPSTLILDIRPHAAHASARVHRALSLSVPSTLLKRPLYSLSKLTQMLPSAAARARFAAWPNALRILVYDADSALTPDNSNIAGLLRKFRAEGFSGELGWVRGGFQAVWREAREFATTELPSPEDEESDPLASTGTLRTKHLPKVAFSLSSTTTGANMGNRAPQTPAPTAANPFFDTIRQNVELSQGITERIPLRLPRRVRRRINDLPFKWLQDVARKSALRGSGSSARSDAPSMESESESSDDPHTSDPDENDPDAEEGAEALAMQFYRIELAEQRRLRTVMEHHSRESEVTGHGRSSTMSDMDIDRVTGQRGAGRGLRTAPTTPHPTPFPFSITAGVEKGAKNRYNYIWPFEHARVRLHDARHQGSHPGKKRRRSADWGSSPREQGTNRDRYDEREREGKVARETRWRASPEVDRELMETSRAGGDVEGQGSTVQHSLRVQFQTPDPPQVNERAADEDSRMSEPPTPAVALPQMPYPAQSPMEISPVRTPMRARPQLPPLTALRASTEGTQLAVPVSSLPALGPLPSFPLRIPPRPQNTWPPIGPFTPSTSFPVPLGSATSILGGFLGDLDVQSGSITDQRLQEEPEPVDDYVNASYVQPLGTKKRYIATQGPLPATYVDFWTLVWEQNVHVIVMLTREVENAVVKCGAYWTDTRYGPFHLELLSTSPPISSSADLSLNDPSKQGFFFGLREPPTKNSAGKDPPMTIMRTFALSHTSYPGVPPRKVTHIQFLDWPDMNVPDDPKGVLDLIARVERAVAESTPGPSPGGSLSPDSEPFSPTSENGSDHGDSTFSITSHSEKQEKRGRGWRHPELDAKTGIARFALGRPAPVLLHCSAGVGRTGGYIAVDAVLDAVRREMRKRRDAKVARRGMGMDVDMNAVAGTGAATDAETIPGGADESTQTAPGGAASKNEKSTTEVEETTGTMNVDKSITSASKSITDALIVGTVPLHVSAGEHKDYKRHHGAASFGRKESRSSESLVVHVPVAIPDTSKAGGTADLQLDGVINAHTQSFSTREWVEKVSDQMHVQADQKQSTSFIPDVPTSSREESPANLSSGSGPSALNSVDDSASGSGFGSASGSGSKSGSVSGTSGSKSGSRSTRAPPSSLMSVSNSGSGSISASNSGSGATSGFSSGPSGTTSSSFMGLMHARFRDSSATSLSNFSVGSSPREDTKSVTQGRIPSVQANTDTSRLPRSISVPPQPPGAAPSTANPPRSLLQRRAQQKPSLGSSAVASLSSPILGHTKEVSFFGVSEPSKSLSRTSSGHTSDELISLPQEFESSASADTEESTNESRKSSQVLSDESEARLDVMKVERAPDSAAAFVKGNATSNTGSLVKEASSGIKAKSKVAFLADPIPYVPEVAENQPSTIVGDSGNVEANLHTAGQSVIDYKLPRELHTDLSPPLLSSYADPICMVIQDMREQRMSLCQSLRQYVFVHAAVIEGALRIVDEERELWGDSGGSDESGLEVDIGMSVKSVGRRSDEGKPWYGRNAAEVTTMGPKQGSIRQRVPSFPSAPYTIGGRSPEISSADVRLPPTTASSSSGASSSPSKGKRGPSPTELQKEDKTGALLLNKRLTVKRKLSDDDSVESPFNLGVTLSAMGTLAHERRDPSGTS